MSETNARPTDREWIRELEAKLLELREAREADQQKANAVIAHWHEQAVNAELRARRAEAALKSLSKLDHALDKSSISPQCSDQGGDANAERVRVHPSRTSRRHVTGGGVDDGSALETSDRLNTTSKLPTDHPLIRAERAEAERDELLGAIREHCDTLDRAAAGGPQPRHRDEVDNALYNVAHRLEGDEEPRG